ncbi:MAG TPA: CHASE3 domain-containing protein, partial [Solirubrobacterales bacterium]|nr:CHASE3 domain-containing protein [Solirubrobacterales bacterium]
MTDNPGGMRPRGGLAWLFRNRVTLAFSVGAALLLAIVIIAVGALTLAGKYESVRETGRILDELDGLLLAVTDAEAGQRGFLMTADERYLEPYLAALGALDRHLGTLGRLTEGNPRLQPRVQALRPLIMDKLDELRATVHLGRDHRPEAALQRVLTGRGRQLMEQIRSRVATMKAEENLVQEEHSRQYARQARDVLLALGTLAAGTFVVLALVLVEYRRRAGEIRLARHALQSQVAEHEKTSALLASIVQSSDDAIVGLGPDGRVLTWNAGAQRLYGYPADSVQGRPIDLLFPGPRQADLADRLDRVLRAQAVERLETEQVTQDGRRIHVFMTISPIRDVADAVVGASIVARDVTAR